MPTLEDAARRDSFSSRRWCRRWWARNDARRDRDRNDNRRFARRFSSASGRRPFFRSIRNSAGYLAREQADRKTARVRDRDKTAGAAVAAAMADNTQPDKLIHSVDKLSEEENSSPSPAAKSVAVAAEAPAIVDNCRVG